MKNKNINLCINETLLASEKYRQSITDFIKDWYKDKGNYPTAKDIKDREEFQDLFTYEADCFIKQVEDIK